MMHPDKRHNPFLAQWLIFVAAVLIVGIGTGYEIQQERVRVELREQERLLAMSRVIQVSVEENLDSINQVLASLSKDVASGQVNGGLDARLRTLADAMPGVRTLTIHNVSGRILYASRPELVGKNENFSQREYFKVPQQHPDLKTLYISPPFLTSLGSHSIVVTRIVPGPRGVFGGVVTATLDPAYFGPLLDAVSYAPDMMVALIHGDGVVYLTVPTSENNLVGKNIAKSGALFMRHRARGQSVSIFSGTALALGDERLMVQRDIWPSALKMDKPLVVAVSRPLNEIYRSWRGNSLVTVWVFFLALLSLAVGLYIYQRRERVFRQQELLAAQNLAESEQRLKTIIETEPECVKVQAPDGTIEQMNRAGLAMIEADSVAQVIGSKIADLVIPAHRAAFNALNEHVLSGESGSLAFEIVGLKGTHRWLEMHAVPMTGGHGKPVGLLSVTRDITARKQAEDAIRLSEERLQRAELISRSGNWEIHLDGGRVVASVGATKIYGIHDRASDSLAVAQDIALPEYRPLLDAALHALIENDVPYDVEYKIRAVDSGEIKDIHSAATFDREKQVVFGILQDITERKLHERALRESEQRFRHIFENNGSVMLLIEPGTGKIVDANQAALRFYGYPNTTLIGMSINQVNTLQPEDVYTEMQQAVQEKRNYFRFTHRLASGDIREVEVYSSPTDVGGETLLLSVIHDVTERKQAEARLQLAASVFLHAREGIAITDAHGVIIDVNDTFTTITGYSREDAIGQPPRLLKSGLHDTQFYTDLWAALVEEGFWAGEVWNKRKNGEVFPVLNTITAVSDVAGITQNYVALFTDITEIKQYQLRLECLAHYDVLTGLPNRMLLADRLRQAIVHSQRNNRVLAVVYLDLDGFKEVNDQYGHEMGDKLLIAIAQRFKDGLRAEDTVARLGGDEFVAILADLESPQSCEPALERLMLAAAEPVVVDDTVLYVSASAGVACYPQDGNEADVLLRRADQAMYLAKQSGKNRYSMFASLPSG